MRRRPDLIVIGGGPAGSVVAALAAGAGAATVLLERERFPRDKVCGEFVSAEGCGVLERLGVLEELLAAGSSWMDACRITDRRGASLDLDLPQLNGRAGRALGVSRERLDGTLLERAARAGVEIRERCEAVDPLMRGGRVCGVVAREVGTRVREEIEASLVVAADGRRSVLARKLHSRPGDPGRSDPRSWFGLKVHLAADPSRLGRRVELHLFDGGYAGLGAVEGSRVNLCLLTTVRALRACGGSPDRLLVERVSANPAARRSIGDGQPCSRWKSVGPLRFGVRRASASGALFVGDAAGTIDPFSGEGMAHALLGAELALPYVKEAAACGGLSEDLGSAYREAWEAAFAPVTRRVRRVGRLFERPSLAGPLLRLLAGPGRGVAPRILAATRTGRDL